MSRDPAILAEGLVKCYPVAGGFRDLIRHPLRRETKTALDGASLRVEKGHCFGLLGPNGAGKTTLIKVLTTLVLPNGGIASVGGHDVERDPASVRRTIGCAINDERSFYWRLTGRQNLEFFGALDGLRGLERDRRIDEALRRTNLLAAAGFRFNTYSTGMRQMLAFARALLRDADILFVDEPTRSLDPQAADMVRTFLRRDLVEGRGKTVFWATHNLAEAAEVAHEIAVIARGRVRLQGSISALTENGRVALPAVYAAAVREAGGPEPGANEGSTA